MKKRADKSGARFDGGQVGLNATAKRFVSAQWGLADALALEVVPDELVGVQLGRIARQEMQFQSPGQLLDVLGDHLSDVGGMAIEDQEHGALAATHEVPEQRDEPGGIEPLRIDLVPESSARVDGADRTHILPPAARGHLRGLPSEA